MRNTLLGIGIFIISAGTANADGFMCSKFATELKTDKIIKMQEMSRDLQTAAMFSLGVYLATTKQVPSKFNEEDFGRYLEIVFDKCRASPSKLIIDIALSEMERYKPQLGRTRTNSSYEQIKLIDLKLDIEKMSGRAIETAAQLQIIGEFAMVKGDTFDTTPIFLDFKRIPREQRKQILEECNMGCSATIRGKVGEIAYQKGIIADDITIN
jgi:hypothetical protein